MKQRYEFVDIAKGICILLIARGHLNYNFFPDYVNENEFYRIFYVSAFMLIAGFFVKENLIGSIINTIKSKGKSLYLKSLYFFIPATILHNYFIDHGLLSDTIERYASTNDWIIALLKVIFGISFEKMVEPLWFALTLFYGFIILSVVVRLLQRLSINSKAAIFGTLFGIASLSCYFSNYTSFHIPPRLGSALTCSLLIYVGHWLFKYCVDYFYSKKVTIIAVLCLLMYTYTTGLDRNSYLIGLIVNQYPDVVTLLIGTIAGLQVICFIGIVIQKNIVGKILAFCGRESFYIMALHMFFYRFLVKMFSSFYPIYVDREGSIYPNGIQFFIIFSVTICLILLIRHIYSLKIK